MIQTYQPVTGVLSAQGLDVANYQGQFDWAAAKQQIPQLQFGIYRATQGLTMTDQDAEWNHNQIGANGLHRGAYHFLDPGQPGAKQALFHMQEISKLGIDSSHMLWLDNETMGASPAAVSSVAQAYMAELHILAPHNPKGVYTYIDFAKTGNCDGLGGWPLWLAYPNLAAPVAPPEWTRWLFWQWGLRDGTSTDAFNGTSGELQAWIESFLPAPPRSPYRHVADGTLSLAQIAEKRGTTVEHIIEVTAGALKRADVLAEYQAIASLALPAGFIYYTTDGGNP